MYRKILVQNGALDGLQLADATYRPIAAMDIREQRWLIVWISRWPPDLNDLAVEDGFPAFSGTYYLGDI